MGVGVFQQVLELTEDAICVNLMAREFSSQRGSTGRGMGSKIMGHPHRIRFAKRFIELMCTRLALPVLVYARSVSFGSAA